MDCGQHRPSLPHALPSFRFFQLFVVRPSSQNGTLAGIFVRPGKPSDNISITGSALRPAPRLVLVAVGTIIADRPLRGSVRARLRIRLL